MRYLTKYRQRLKQKTQYRSVITRWALGVVMFLAGIHKVFEPALWSDYMAQWLTKLMILPLKSAIVVLGLAEIVLGIAILADYKTDVTASFASIAFLILLFNLLTTGQHLDVLFMNIGLFGLSLGVALNAAE